MCPDKEILLLEYSAATDQYSGALSALYRVQAKVPRDEYERLRSAVEVARIKVEGLLLALEIHLKKHGC